FPLTGRRVRMPTLLPLWRAARTTGKQCGLTATGDYQPSLRSPWLAANEIPSPYLGGNELPIGGAFLVEASRGCPYSCAFCVWGGGGKLREYQFDRVEAELVAILSKQPSHIMFCDGTFNLRRKRATNILQIIVNHLRDGCATPFSLLLELKLELIDDDLAKVIDELLTLNPLATFEFGLQTTGQEASKLVRRKFSGKKYFAAWSRLSPKVQSSVILDCIYGLPGDSVDDFMSTIDFCYRLAPHRIQGFRLTILPGSEFDCVAEKLGIKFMHEPPHMVFKTPNINLREMVWLEAFAFAVADLYHFHGTLIKALMGMKHTLQINSFSALILQFVNHVGERSIIESSYAGNRPEGRWRGINLSNDFGDFVFRSLLPAHDVIDDSILRRLKAIFSYEERLGRIAISGLPDTTHVLDGYKLTADVMEIEFDLPTLIRTARGKMEVYMDDLIECSTSVAITEKAGHQGVRVPIAYRVRNNAVLLLNSVREGIRPTHINTTSLSAMLSRLAEIGLIARVST
ncbi:MAG: radical SAM protein, partial [Candidatus Sedimenticola sp. (ex Thyasira tokunagai)]